MAFDPLDPIERAAALVEHDCAPLRIRIRPGSTLDRYRSEVRDVIALGRGPNSTTTLIAHAKVVTYMALMDRHGPDPVRRHGRRIGRALDRVQREEVIARSVLLMMVTPHDLRLIALDPDGEIKGRGRITLEMIDGYGPDAVGEGLAGLGYGIEVGEGWTLIARTEDTEFSAPVQVARVTIRDEDPIVGDIAKFAQKIELWYQAEGLL